MSLQFLSFPPTNQQPPTGLVICLHGWGANYYDLVSLAATLNLPQYQFLFPDAPFPHPYVPGGKMWYDLESQDYQGLTESRQQLRAWLEGLEQETGIPRSRTIVTGFSQGGAMTLDVGLGLPFAGLVSLSGYLHAPPQLASEKVPPVLMIHGKQDPVVPVRAAQQAKDTLTHLGVSVQYHEFNMGHQIIPEVLDLERQFILEVMPEVRV